jgi:ABC-type multidrug transport system fused ATPase/permease subunit
VTVDSSIPLARPTSAGVPYRRTFGRLLGFLGPYKVSLAGSMALAFGAQAIQIVAMLLSGAAIGAITDKNEHRLYVIIAVLVSLGIVRAALMVGRRFIAGNQALGVEYDLRMRVYSKLVRLPFSFYDRHQTGQLMSRATVDLTSVRFFLGYGLIFFAQNLITVVGVALAMFYLHWQLALAVLAVTPIIIATAYRFSHISHPLLRDVQQKKADVATAAEENITGVHVVKAFAQEEAEAGRFAERNELLFTRSIEATRQRAFYMPVLSFLPVLTLGGVVMIGGLMVIHGQLDAAWFTSFIFLLFLLVPALRLLGSWVSQAQRATAAGERIFEIIDEPEEIAERPDARELPDGAGEIRFEGVSFAYGGGPPVLEDVDLVLEPGKTTALIGQTGSGKTTLASLVPRFYDVSSGHVLVDGADVRELRLASLRRAIAVIAQDPFLFSASVSDNLAFGRPDASEEEIEQAARLAQAHDFVRELPDGYETIIGERGVTLSGGQRQRIAIARALLTDPRILILDDATASVDATTEALIRSGIREAARGRTTIVIAHRLTTIALADEIIVLEKGRIAARGHHDDLLQTSDVYREIYEHGLVEQELAGRLEDHAGTEGPGKGAPQ